MSISDWTVRGSTASEAGKSQYTSKAKIKKVIKTDKDNSSLCGIKA
jgi:hypothetical protein